MEEEPLLDLKSKLLLFRLKAEFLEGSESITKVKEHQTKWLFGTSHFAVSLELVP